MTALLLRPLRLCSCALLIIGLLLPISEARANDFEAFVKTGVAAYRASNYDVAIDSFRSAYRLKPNPTLLFNLGRCFERKGDIDNAISHYRTYVDAPGTTTEGRASALEKIKNLQKEKAARAALDAPPERAPPLPKLTNEKTKKPEGSPSLVLPILDDDDPPTAKAPPKPKTKSDVVVIVNTKNSSDSAVPDFLARLYLGKVRKWDSGTTAKVIARPNRSPASRAFFAKLPNVTPVSYSRHWQRQQLAGSALAPTSIANPQQVIREIRANPGAVSYMLRSELPKKLPAGIRILEFP